MISPGLISNVIRMVNARFFVYLLLSFSLSKQQDYFLAKETYDAFSGLEEYKRLDKEDKGALVVATIFSILSTLIVLVLEFFWCRVSCCECCPQSEYEDLERN